MFLSTLLALSPGAVNTGVQETDSVEEFRLTLFLVLLLLLLQKVRKRKADGKGEVP